MNIHKLLNQNTLLYFIDRIGMDSFLRGDVSSLFDALASGRRRERRARTCFNISFAKYDFGFRLRAQDVFGLFEYFIILLGREFGAGCVSGLFFYVKSMQQFYYTQICSFLAMKTIILFYDRTYEQNRTFTYALQREIIIFTHKCVLKYLMQQCVRRKENILHII